MWSIRFYIILKIQICVAIAAHLHPPPVTSTLCVSSSVHILLNGFHPVYSQRKQVNIFSSAAQHLVIVTCYHDTATCLSLLLLFILSQTTDSILPVHSAVYSADLS